MIRTATLALALALPATGQTTWIVDVNATPPGSGTSNDPYASIQFAIAQPTTVAGDTVLVRPGTYLENVDFLGKAVTLSSEGGADVTEIDAAGSGSAVTFASSEGAASVLEGFTLTKGEGTMHLGFLSGGGLFCDGASPTIRDCAIADNDGARGAGAYFAQSNATLERTTFRFNRAELAWPDPNHGGGAYVTGSTLSFSECDFFVNLALSSHDERGGGLWISDGSSVSLDQCAVTGNRAQEAGRGGGIYITDSTLDVTDSEFVSNSVGLADKSPGTGGAIYALGSVLTIDGTMFENNNGGFSGGGIASVGSALGAAVLVTNSHFEGNRGEFGGAVSGTFELIGCTLIGNTAPSPFGGNGEGAAALGATPRDAVLRECVVRGNSGAFMGGGVENCTLEDCIVEDNVAEAFGGGIAFCTATNCRIVGNRTTSTSMFASAGSGGGAYRSMLERSTVVRNSAQRGGGAYASDLVHCSLFENVATVAGGGIYGGDIQSVGSSAVSSILWANTPEEFVSGVNGATFDYCIVPGAGGTGNFYADPLFWNTTTGDLHLRSGSPAIDAGHPALPNDPDGSVADMGVFPFDAAYCGEPGTYCVAKLNSDGCLPGIGSSGLATLSGPDFVVSVTDVLPDTFGLLAWSLTPDDAPFFGGTLCMGAPIVRTGVQNSGGTVGVPCSGSFSYAFTASYLTGQGVVAGDILHAQYWYRDPGLAVPNNIGLSDGVAATVCP